jgi:hypothetical protein
VLSNTRSPNTQQNVFAGLHTRVLNADVLKRNCLLCPCWRVPVCLCFGVGDVWTRLHTPLVVTPSPKDASINVLLQLALNVRRAACCLVVFDGLPSAPTASPPFMALQGFSSQSASITHLQRT